MIDVQVHVHDNYSIEFKVGYKVDSEIVENDFQINTWIFIPNSLDINKFTYSKKQFYRDVKSHVRLITPIYDLSNVCKESSFPRSQLNKSIKALYENYNQQTLDEYEYQIKMYAAIIKSALRKRVDQILEYRSTRNKIINETINDIANVTNYFRHLKIDVKENKGDSRLHDYYTFADEFISNSIEQQGFRLLHELKEIDMALYKLIAGLVKGVIQREVQYKERMGYGTLKLDDKLNNRALVYRRRALKKYIESHLYLQYDKQKEGLLAEQVYYSIAAGISMIFATVIGFAFQHRFGNFTTPLFVALVVSYMLKDRIKELMRYYFIKRMSKKSFDNKTKIRIKEKELGWLKESTDFMSETNIPSKVLSLRNRSNLLEADNRTTKEKIILYRKLVRINGIRLAQSSDYDIAGLNNILRFNLSNYVLKMDNPRIAIPYLDSNDHIEHIMGEKIYYVNLVLQFKTGDTDRYKRYRLIMTRKGIRDIEYF